MKLRLLIGTVLVALAAALISYPLVSQIRALSADRETSEVANAQAKKINKEELDAAFRYNEKLARSGQPSLGGDPFTNPVADWDTEYTSLLNADDPHVMATISFPRLSINLRVGHGTSHETLADMAGHMVGTSLPVGGVNTNAVISAHRGDPTHLLFTRLDEARRGDSFYIHVAGQTLGYKVREIAVIDPDDFDALKIREGEDLVTLMTCTPYGVNTHRLLVIGERALIPQEIPAEHEVQADSREGTTILILVAVWLVALSMIAFAWWRTLRQQAEDTSLGKQDNEADASPGENKQAPTTGQPRHLRSSRTPRFN